MNDFVKGVEILVDCKRYVERRLLYLQHSAEQMKMDGKDTTWIKREISDIEDILCGGKYNEF